MVSYLMVENNMDKEILNRVFAEQMSGARS